LAFEGYVIDTDHWRHFFVLAALIWGMADATRIACDPARRQSDVPS
jgi:hypothetical protein